MWSEICDTWCLISVPDCIYKLYNGLDIIA